MSTRLVKFTEVRSFGAITIAGSHEEPSAIMMIALGSHKEPSAIMTSVAGSFLEHDKHLCYNQYLRHLCQDRISRCRMNTPNPNNLGDNAFQ